MVGEKWRCDLVLGLHLGRDGYQHRAVRDHLRENDINWNMPYSSNIRKGAGLAGVCRRSVS